MTSRPPAEPTEPPARGTPGPAVWERPPITPAPSRAAPSHAAARPDAAPSRGPNRRYPILEWPTDPALDTPPAWPAPRPSPPTVVRVAYWLWMLGLAVGVASSALAIGPSTAPIPPPKLVVIALVVVLVAVQTVLAILARGGRQSARVVMTILGVLAVLTAAARLAGASSTAVDGQPVPTLTPAGAVLATLQIVIVLLGVVLWFRPRANAYVAAVGAAGRRLRPLL